MKHKWTGRESWIPKITKIIESSSGIKHKEVDLVALMADELGKQREEIIKETLGLCRAYMQDHSMADVEFSVAIYKLKKSAE